MDDATRLITDLEVKLAELDNKVAAYRQDLADEFNRYAQGLLTNLDPAVSARVQDAVANSLSSYPAISPALTAAAHGGWSRQEESAVSAIPRASIDTVAPTPALATPTPALETPTEASATPATPATPAAVPTPQSPTPTPTLLPPTPTLPPPPPTTTAGFYRAESPLHPPHLDAPSPSLMPAPGPAPAPAGSGSPPVPVAHCPSTSSTFISPDTTTTGTGRSNNNNTGASDSAITASAATPSPSAPAAASHFSADHEGPPPTSGLPRPSTPPPHPLSSKSSSSSEQPTPSPYDPQGIDHMPDSPDDREAELRGVFTPTFLPLVDGSFHRLRSPPTPPRSRSSNRSITSTIIKNLPTMDVAGSIAAAGVGDQDAVDSAASSSPSSVQLPTRPSTGGRRATDDVSTSSALSDKSDSKSRRSALRRSSNPAKPQSPRRVRFDVGGSQVLPTSSPSTSLQDVRQHLSGASGLKEEVDPTRPLSAAVILGLSDLEAHEDPPPKKVSSSQALRALSKLPLDSSTVWIPVTQDPDPDADEEDIIIPAPALSKAKNSLTSLRDADKFRRTPGGSAAKRPPDRVRTLLGAPVQQRGWQEEEEDQDSDDSSDDDFLSMAKSKSSKRPPASPSPERKAAPVPLSEASATATSAGASKSTADTLQLDNASQAKKNVVAGSSEAKQQTAEPASRDYEDFDGGDVFDFEVSEGMPKPAPPQVFKPDEEVGSEAEDESHQHRGPLNLYSTSPAVDIAPPPLQHPQPSSSASTSGPAPGPAPTPTLGPALTARFQVPTVGSYKGRSITMPVVVNPEVHERAAALGDFNTFVGGLDGRSGMDDGDLSSFRASLSGPLVFSGTPRSLTERFLMEEAMGLAERDNEPVVLK